MDIEAQRELIIDGYRADGERMTRTERLAAEARLNASVERATFAGLADREGKVFAAKLVKGRFGPCWVRPDGTFLSDKKAAAMGLHRIRVTTRARVGRDGAIVQAAFPTQADRA